MTAIVDLRKTLIFVAAFALTACASVPAPKRGATAAQPLATHKVTQPPADEDALAQMLAGEFALGDANLPDAARRYAAAAALSDDPSVAAQATRLALAAKDYKLARETLTRWRALRPGDSGVVQTDAALALVEGDTEAAFRALDSLNAQPQGQGWRLIGQVLLGATDKEAAGKLLERLAMPSALAAANEETWVALSQLAYKLERKAYARQLADAAVKKFGGSKAYSWSAQLAGEEGDKMRARMQYAEAIKRSPKDIRLRAAYAILLGEEGDNPAAARVLAEGPQDEYTYAARAAYVARSRDKALIQALYDELKNKPADERVARAELLGQLAEMLEQKSTALTWYQQVRDDDEHWFESQVRVAVLLQDQGKHDAALAITHELQARAGDEPKKLGDAYLLEAELVDDASSEAALAVYSRGLNVLPDDTRLIYARALRYANDGRTAEAERDLRRVLELKPADVDAMNALGYTLADANQKLEEAYTLIQAALKAKPEEPAVIDSLGWVQFRRGHLAEAETALRRAYEKQPDAEIASHLGEVLWHRGNKDEAKTILEAGRKKDAKNKSLLDTLKRLGL
jgi:Flp pilus assembly protein TadD